MDTDRYDEIWNADDLDRTLRKLEREELLAFADTLQTDRPEYYMPAHKHLAVMAATIRAMWVRMSK